MESPSRVPVEEEGRLDRKIHNKIKSDLYMVTPTLLKGTQALDSCMFDSTKRIDSTQHGWTHVSKDATQHDKTRETYIWK